MSLDPRAFSRAMRPEIRQYLVYEQGCRPWNDNPAACGYCGTPLTVEWAEMDFCVSVRDANGFHAEIDHDDPIALGGPDAIGNLVLACMPCNRSKGAKSFEEWTRPVGVST